MEFSDKIKQIIQKRNLTQEQLAEDLNVSFATVNRWCQGHIKPRESTLLQIEKYCNEHCITINEEEKPNLHVGIDLINASDLENWFRSQQRLSQGIFPELIEKLIIESSSFPLKLIDFPSKDKIVLNGFDGVVTSNEINNYYVPYKESIWEIGATLNDSKGKIKADYQKRKNETTIEFRKNTTFILVTAKSFSYNTKKDLQSEFEKDNWKEVKIYDGVILEQWLSQCLETSLWLYEKFKNERINIKTFEKAFSDLENRTNPPISPNLFTNTREKDVEKLLDDCNKYNVIKVSSPSIEETYGFVLSAIQKDINNNIKQKIIVCNDLNTLYKLDSLSNNKIFIIKAIGESLDLNIRNKCIILFGKNTYKNNMNIVLNPRPQNCIYEVLSKEMNVPDSKISDLRHKANNNLTLIMRALASESYISMNDWLTDPELKKLLPITIVGKINTNNQSDREILSYFLNSNEGIDDYITYLQSLGSKDNCPLSFYSDIISVNLKEEIWSTISNSITSSILNKLKSKLIEIFTENNPKYDLPVDKQPAHTLYDKTWKYNKYVVEGLLDSCILSTIYNEKQSEMDITVKNILSNIDSKQAMLTVSDYLLHLAELSPSQFMLYLEEEIKNKNSVVLSLFDNSSNYAFFSGGSEYCNLLWALELLMKFSETKIKACDMLMFLYSKNFTYKIANSPKDSIMNNLHWMNNKNAINFKEKSLLILKYIKRYKQQFIPISIELISKNNIFTTTLSPRWKPAAFNDEVITYQMIFEQTEYIVQNILSAIDQEDIFILFKLLDVHFYLTKKCLITINSFLKEKYNKNTSQANELYEYFIKKKYHLIKYAKDEKYEEFLKMCDDCINFFKPQDMLDSSVLFFKNFGYNCPIIEAIDNDFQKEDEKVNNYQTSLFKTLYQKYHKKNLWNKIIKSVPNEGVAGYFFAKQDINNDDVTEIIQLAEIEKKYNFLLVFLNTKDVELYKNYLNKQDEATLENMLPSIRNFKEIPVVIIKNENLLQKLYKHREYNPSLDVSDISLIKKYNPVSYLRYILYDRKNTNWDCNDIIETLNNISRENISNSNDYYYIKKILLKLENMVNNIDMLQLEIKFFDVFDYDELPNSLKKYLFENPNEYANLITQKSNKDKSFLHFWFKLNNYMQFPNDFKLYPDKVKNFVTTLMNYSSEEDNENLLLKSNLGGILARSYRNGQDKFIPDELRDIIEELSNPEVNRGVIIGYENLRGVRSVTDGSPELELSKKFEQEAKDNEIYPQTAYILRVLSKSRLDDSKRDKLDRMMMDGLI